MFCLGVVLSLYSFVSFLSPVQLQWTIWPGGVLWLLIITTGGVRRLDKEGRDDYYAWIHELPLDSEIQKLHFIHVIFLCHIPDVYVCVYMYVLHFQINTWKLYSIHSMWSLKSLCLLYILFCVCARPSVMSLNIFTSRCQHTHLNLIK